MSHILEMSPEQYEHKDFYLTEEEIKLAEEHNKVLWRKLYETVQHFNSVDNPNDNEHIIVENYKVSQLIKQYEELIDKLEN